MKTQNPKISVILPTYNGSKFIKDALNSVLMQDESDFELIIVNDCSTDNSLEIINEYANKDHRIKVINNEFNLKLPSSLNIGYKESRGKYITWISDDNIFKQGALKFMSEYLDSYSNVDLISCAMDFKDENGIVFKKTDKVSSRKSAGQLAGQCNIGACFMYTKEIADKVGEYDSNLFCGEDYDYWCRIALIGNIHYSQKNFYTYRTQSQSLSQSKAKTLNEKTVIIQKKYAEKLLKKYRISRQNKANIFYAIWKNEKATLKPLLKAFMMNPFYIGIKLFLLGIRETGKTVKKDHFRINLHNS